MYLFLRSCEWNIGFCKQFWATCIEIASVWLILQFYPYWSLENWFWHIVRYHLQTHSLLIVINCLDISAIAVRSLAIIKKENRKWMMDPLWRRKASFFPRIAKPLELANKVGHCTPSIDMLCNERDRPKLRLRWWKKQTFLSSLSKARNALICSLWAFYSHWFVQDDWN